MPSSEQQEAKTEREAAPVSRVPQSPRAEAIETIIEKEVRISQPTTRNAPRAEAREREQATLQNPAPPAPSADPPVNNADRIRELEERLETIRDRKSRPLSTKPIEAALKPAATSSGSKPASVPPAPVVPEIRVTIGRLEIHAATPSPPRSMRARSAAPRLSLEAYLRSRSGGNKE